MPYITATRTAGIDRNQVATSLSTYVCSSKSNLGWQSGNPRFKRLIRVFLLFDLFSQWSQLVLGLSNLPLSCQLLSRFLGQCFLHLGELSLQRGHLFVKTRRSTVGILKVRLDRLQFRLHKHHQDTITVVSQMEFNVPFQHKYGYIRDKRSWAESYPFPVKESQRYINLNPGRLFVQQPAKKGKGSKGSFTLLRQRLHQGKTTIAPQD